MKGLVARNGGGCRRSLVWMRISACRFSGKPESFKMGSTSSTGSSTFWASIAWNLKSCSTNQPPSRKLRSMSILSYKAFLLSATSYCSKSHSISLTLFSKTPLYPPIYQVFSHLSRTCKSTRKSCLSVELLFIFRSSRVRLSLRGC